MKTYTKETLAALPRSRLIATAVKLNATAPKGLTLSQTRTPILIDLVLKSQKAVAAPPVEVAVVLPEKIADDGSIAVETTAVAVADPPTAPVGVFAGSPEDVDDHAAFGGPRTEQDHEPAEPDAGDPALADPAPAQPEIPVERPKKPVHLSMGIFKVSRKVFQRQLAVAGKAITSKYSMPILGNVLIEFANGKLKVEGTNLDLYISSEVPAETTGEAAVTVPFKRLQAFVGKCTTDFLMAEVISNYVLRISDLANNKTELWGISKTEWPPSPPIGAHPLMEIDGKVFATVIRETLCCASTDETRYILNGIAVETTTPEKAVVVATDGRRLVRVPLGAKTLAPWTPQCKEAKRMNIIPSFAADAILNTIPKDALAIVTTDLADNARRLTVAVDAPDFTYRLWSRVVEGNYPNYAQVIPKERNFEFIVPVEQFLKATARIYCVVTEKSNSMKMEFTKNMIKLSANSPSLGEGKEPIDVTGEGLTHARTGKEVPLIVAVNPMFPYQILSSWAVETVSIAVKDEVSPILLSAGERIAVIMPVRLS